MKDVKKNLTMIFCVGPLLVLGDLAKMEVVVVDDDTGLPMTNVTVKGTFPINNGWSAFKGAARPNTDVQNTNAKGWCRLSGETNKKVAWCEVEAVSRVAAGDHGGSGGGDVDRAVLHQQGDIGLHGLAHIAGGSEGDGAVVHGDGIVGGDALAVHTGGGEGKVATVDGDIAVGREALAVGAGGGELHDRVAGLAVDLNIAVALDAGCGIGVALVAGIGVGAACASHRQVDIAAVDDHAAVGVDALAARCRAAHGDGQVGAAVDIDIAVALQTRAV